MAASAAAAAAPLAAIPEAPIVDAQRVLDFWFGAKTSPTYLTFRREWFMSSTAFDDEIRAAFGATLEAALAGGLKEWDDHPASLLAKIIVLDQFTRNLGRGTAAAFAGDAEALRLSMAAATAGTFDAWPGPARQFALMPFMHSEDGEVQARGEEVEWPKLPAYHNPAAQLAKFVREHRDIIQRFGRFPHRNGALGRVSTPAEVAYLAADAPSYGQTPAPAPAPAPAS